MKFSTLITAFLFSATQTSRATQTHSLRGKAPKASQDRALQADCSDIFYLIGGEFHAKTKTPPPPTNVLGCVHINALNQLNLNSTNIDEICTEEATLQEKKDNFLGSLSLADQITYKDHINKITSFYCTKYSPVPTPAPTLTPTPPPTSGPASDSASNPESSPASDSASGNTENGAIIAVSVLGGLGCVGSAVYILYRRHKTSQVNRQAPHIPAAVALPRGGAAPAVAQGALAQLNLNALLQTDVVRNFVLGSINRIIVSLGGLRTNVVNGLRAVLNRFAFINPFFV